MSWGRADSGIVVTLYVCNSHCKFSKISLAFFQFSICYNQKLIYLEKNELGMTAHTFNLSAQKAERQVYFLRFRSARAT